MTEIINTAAARMQKTAANLAENLGKIRSGRAHAGMLDNIVADCYGAETPIAHVATVAVADSRTLSVTVWDKQNVAAVEKAIRNSDLGVNPAASGQTLRVPLPPLSEERRLEMTKIVGRETEDSRVAARNIRRDALAAIKGAVKDKSMGEDEGKRLEHEAQTLTDKTIKQMEEMAAAKQKELMTV
jgi:ribosome recycling factor